MKVREVDIGLKYFDTYSRQDNNMLLIISTELGAGHTIYADLMPYQARHFASLLAPEGAAPCFVPRPTVAGISYLTARGGTINGEVGSMRLVISAKNGTVSVLIANERELVCRGQAVKLSKYTDVSVASALSWHADKAYRQLPDLPDVRGWHI